MTRKTASAVPRQTSEKNSVGLENAEEERILAKAQNYLLFEARRPLLWTVAGIREDERAPDGSRRWIIAVHLRYPTGFEGYLGDLLFNGTRFSELTAIELMRERARKVEADPEGIQKWNEYRDPVLPAREK